MVSMSRKLYIIEPFILSFDRSGGQLQVYEMIKRHTNNSLQRELQFTLFSYTKLIPASVQKRTFIIMNFVVASV